MKFEAVRKFIFPAAITLTCLLVLFVLPMFIVNESGQPICLINSAAAQQDSPCLVQQNTISAQEVQILQLQLTNSSQELQLLQMQATDTAQEQIFVQLVATLAARPQTIAPVIVTVPVLITPTSLQATPTVADSQVEIVRVIGTGDITVEGVEIRNTGGVIDLTGWILEDSQSNKFTFPEQRLFTNGLLTVFTRRGTNTPISLYWGRSEAVWAEPDVATLLDTDNNVQSVYQVR